MASFSLLASMDVYSLIFLFWYAVLLELPRYFIGALALVVCGPFARGFGQGTPQLSVSILLVGHNEVKALRRCVTALKEQTIAHRLQIVVVDDGSIDGMGVLLRRLRHEGLIDVGLSVAPRGGKSAGVNLGLTACLGDVVVISDIDTTFDCDALEVILRPFADPAVGAVCGNLLPRNARATLVSRQQAIEYLIAISLGRRIDDMLGTLSIVSGAFGAFRRVAIEGVGGQDVEVGEDADLTLKIRRAGWKIRFAPEARAATDVPESMPALIGQRLRWDRGLITIWFRKFRGNFNPFVSTFRVGDMLALVDVLVFQVILTLTFPVYIIWLYYRFGAFAFTVIGATVIGYGIVGTIAFAIAAWFDGDLRSALRLVPYLPLHMLTQSCVMRPVRLIALFQELVFRSSYRDPYVPARVMRQAEQI